MSPLSDANNFELLELTDYMKNVNEFKNKLNDLSKTWDQLILLSQLSSTNINMSDTKSNFDSLTSELSKQLTNETLKKVSSEMNSKAQVAVDIVIRNLFERTADIGFLATDNDVRDFLLELPVLAKEAKSHENDDDTQFIVLNMKLKDKITNIRNRFKEYVAKYSVYYDILLFDKDNRLLAKMDDSNKIKRSSDEVFEIARTTTDDYIETYKKHDFLPDREETLVYTYKVTKSDESDEIVGYLSLCFKFKDEMSGIFKNLVERKNKEVLLLLDSQGNSIASSDPFHIPLKVNLETNLDEDYKITQFAGRDYLVKTCKTHGYEGFYGLGWLGHIMVPLDSAFNTYTKNIEIDEKILHSIMKNEQLFGKELLGIPQKAQDIQDQLDRAVWNGNLIKIDGNEASSEFTRSILREVKNTGEKTKDSFGTSIEKLNQTIISSLINNVTFLASLSIDIMDRNLYERANDVRWWALTATFRDVLSQDRINQEDVDRLESVLKYINNLYTVYTNLFIYDLEGRVIAVSNDSKKSFVGTKLNEKWIEKSLRLSDPSKYSVSFFEKTNLYDDEYTYIYSSSIKDENQRLIGGIGIVFDSTSQFKDMLVDALPKDEDETLDGFSSMYVEKINKKIVSCSNDKFKIGEELNIDESFFQLKNGESLSKILEFDGKYYIVGAKCSNGYREYKSESDNYTNDILAFVFIEAGEIEKSNKLVTNKYNDNYKYQMTSSEEFLEIATFYIGDKWLGIDINGVIESVTINNLEPVISLEEGKHFKGTTLYKNYVVSVLDIYSFIRTKNSINSKIYNDIILVKYHGANGEHRLGLTVSKLGEVIKVPKKNIKTIESHFIDGGVIGESIIIPPEGSSTKNLLTLINISKLDSLDTRTQNI